MENEKNTSIEDLYDYFDSSTLNQTIEQIGNFKNVSMVQLIGQGPLQDFLRHYF